MQHICICIYCQTEAKVNLHIMPDAFYYIVLCIKSKLPPAEPDFYGLYCLNVESLCVGLLIEGLDEGATSDYVG